MSPRVIDASGRVIYDGSHVDRAYAVDIGIVGYDRDMQRALVSERLGGLRRGYRIRDRGQDSRRTLVRPAQPATPPGPSSEASAGVLTRAY